jgi:hypothetical protein
MVGLGVRSIVTSAYERKFILPPQRPKEHAERLQNGCSAFFSAEGNRLCVLHHGGYIEKKKVKGSAFIEEG